MHRSCTALYASFVISLTGLVVCARPAEAQIKTGVRAGISVNPDQFYFGGHLQTAPIFDKVRFRPNAEIGVGDDTTLAAFNFEFVYPFASKQAWHPYVGAGPAINYYWSNGGSDAKGGFNLLFGLENAKGLFFEAKFGVVDSPDLKIGVGYTFK
jgi:hypothetical protein